MNHSNPLSNQFIQFVKKAKEADNPESIISIAHKTLDMTLQVKMQEPGYKGVCKKGCSHCCKMQVYILAPELFLILQYMEQSMSASKIDKINNKIKKNAFKAKGLTSDQYISKGIPCVFLENNLCSIYEVRPFMCRRYHSLSEEKCRNARHNPDIPLAHHKVIFDIAKDNARMTVTGFEGNGIDSGLYEFNEVLLLSSETPDLRQNWLNREDIFPSNAETLDAIL